MGSTTSLRNPARPSCFSAAAVGFTKGHCDISSDSSCDQTASEAYLQLCFALTHLPLSILVDLMQTTCSFNPKESAARYYNCDPWLGCTFSFGLQWHMWCSSDVSCSVLSKPCVALIAECQANEWSTLWYAQAESWSKRGLAVTVLAFESQVLEQSL